MRNIPPEDPRLFTRSDLHIAVRITSHNVAKSGGASNTTTATGFVVLEDGTYWLVTNRHVVDPSFTDEKYVGWITDRIDVDGRTVGRGEDRPIHLELSPVEPVFHSEPGVDLAVIKLGEESHDLRLPALGVHEFVHESEVIDDEIGVGSEFVMTGYPEVFGKTGVHPILVPGLVSSDLHLPASYGRSTFDGDGLCHSFSRGGMSGAPMLTMTVRESWFGEDRPLNRRTRLLGVNRGHPNERDRVSRLSLFVPAWKLDEIFAELGSQTAQLRVTLSAATRQLRDGDTGTDAAEDESVSVEEANW